MAPSLQLNVPPIDVDKVSVSINFSFDTFRTESILQCVKKIAKGSCWLTATVVTKADIFSDMGMLLIFIIC
jgi:hypothetical protein